MILSICIATMEKRQATLHILLLHLREQIKKLNAEDQVEICINMDKGEKPTGKKRNDLYQNAAGEYVCSVDDDDWVPPYYVEKILKALEGKPDAIGLNGTMTTNGHSMATWDISLFNPYITTRLNGRTHYMRFHNHLSPIKKSIVVQHPFPEIYHGEDYAFALSMHNKNAIVKEVRIPEPMYLYRYQERKN